MTYGVGTDYFFERYNFHFITEKDGLPHCFVDDILQDSDGYIWAATHNGISRYDGYQLLNFNTRTDPVRLKNDDVHGLCEDDFKHLWVASEGGLDIIDLDTYALVDLVLPADSALSRLKDEFIHTVYKDRQGDLWISGSNTLWCLELDAKGDIRDWYKLGNAVSSPVRGMVDMGGTVCAGIDNIPCVLRKKEGHLLEASPLAGDYEPFSEDWRISCMQVDGTFLWIGTNRGLFRYDTATRTLKRYRYSTHRTGMLSQAYITDIELTGQGHLLVSTLNGLNVYHRDTDTFSFIRRTYSHGGFTINCNAILCLFTSGEDVWMGTETGGINLLSLKRLQTEVWNYDSIFGRNDPVPVNAIAGDSAGNLWIAMAEKGLVEWNRGKNTYARYRFSPNDVTSISNNTLTGILIDLDNHLWAYTWGVGINCLDLNATHGTRFRRYTREEFPTIKGDFINSACEDVINHGIWFGSTRGLHFYNKADDSFLQVPFDGVNEEFDAINALMTDRKGRLWVGTTEGVFVVDLFSFAKSHTYFDYKYLKYKLDNPESGRMEKVNCIFEDSRGNIWLGGNGSGLYRLTDDTDARFSFVNYTPQHGLLNNTVLGMAEDKRGYLWILTNDGVSKLDVDSMAFDNYTQADGLPVTQYYRNGIYYSAGEDLICLATTEGMLVIHSEDNYSQAASPEVRLSSLTVAGNEIYPSSGNYLEKAITQKPSITLHEKESRFSVDLTTCNYGNNSRIRFAYRLKGYEGEWNETSPGDCTARYTAVPAGKYTLQVCATNETGHWSDKVTEVPITIVPYFYKTVWFYLLSLLVVCVGVYVVYRRRIRSYRKQKVRLEKKVEERTQKLAVQNKQLEMMAQHVRDVTEEKVVFFMNITHEFRTPVTLIHGPIKHALREVTDGNVKAQLQIAERNSSYLLSLVNELMDFRKLDMDKVTLCKESCDFVSLLSDWLLPFRVFAGERHIEIRLYSRLDTPYLMLDVGYMRKAVVNLVSNAIKFTPDGGRIDIYVASVVDKEKGKLIYINVCDTGHGIVGGDIEKIFDRFYQSRVSEKYPVYGQSGTGIGLFLCRKIIQLHDGEIHARNNPRKGASFRILIPLIVGEKVAHTDEVEVPALSDETILSDEQKQETILIVEDNGDMRAYLRMLLEKRYRLLEVGNGAEALEMVQNHTVDLIVSDLMMPVMDGVELSRRIKENLATSHIPFLMLTALRSDVQERRSFEIGVDEYLCKPFDEDILLLRIRNILELRNKYKRLFSASSNIEELHIKKESKDQIFVGHAMELMKRNYADSEYNLECFVRDMGYSKTLVNKKMQALTGQPIGRFMKTYRLNVAHKMMQEGTVDVNVSEIAYSVGFNDPKYFTKCFKEYFGYLPSSKLRK